MIPTNIRAVTYTKVFIPFVHEVQWSAGKRPGTTRLVIEVHTEDGATGIGETICLLEFVEPVLARTIIPLSIGEDSTRIERITKKIEGAGYYHHKRAMVAALADSKWRFGTWSVNTPAFRFHKSGAAFIANSFP